ncbi:MAG TPA: shikimate dehydrogenase [Prolixibacteraceae bacterium]
MQTYGLIGYPLSHSFSKRFFTAYFEKESIDAEYLNFEISNLSLLPAVIKEHPGLIGFNVTIPYKQAIIPYLDSCDPKAAAINAVNTVKVDRTDGTPRLRGFNTDLIGFRDSLRPLLQTHHSQALVLGTGGASKAVVAVLDDLSIPSLLVSRDSKPGTSISYKDLTRKLLGEHTIIINTTPLGTFPKIEGCPEIPFEYITERHLLFDLVYNPPVTQFLQKGAERGATIKNGYEMLELQALAAWKIWNELENGKMKNSLHRICNPLA